MLDRVQSQLSIPNIFPRAPTISVEAKETMCPCGKALKVQKTLKRKIVTLEIGKLEVYETVKWCPDCQAVFRNNDLRRFTPEYCNYGYDIIEYVGRALFQEYRTIEQIRGALREKNVIISDREIPYLGRKFIFYLAWAHKDKSPEIKQLLLEIGGYILHFDATCDGDSPHLLCAMAEEVDLVLGSVKVPSETTEAVVDFLTTIKEQYGTPLAGVSDMLRSNLAAFEIVFPGIRHFMCHYHFLRDVGKDLIEFDYSNLRDGLKRYGTKTRLRELSKKFKASIDPENLKLHLGADDLSSLINLPPIHLAYILIAWIRGYETELDGYGFPFDLSHLVLFQRMEEAYQFLKQFSDDAIGLAELKYFLAAVVEDPELQKCKKTLQRKSTDFNKLRQAMKIVLPDGKDGLNDEGEGEMKTIEKEVTRFVEREEIKNSIDIAYQKMYQQIKKYWDKLFADPIDVTLPNGEKARVYPQRTNNLLERFFRELNRGNRKRNGCKSLGRTLQTMLAETPLVKNLNNPDYLRVILNGKSTLAERFKEIDSRLIRKNLKDWQSQEDSVPASMKKILKIEGLPKMLLDSVIREEVISSVA